MILLFIGFVLGVVSMAVLYGLILVSEFVSDNL